MMSTLNSSPLSLQNSNFTAPASSSAASSFASQPAAVAPSKRFANIMAKARASAPPAAPPAPSKPVASDQAAQTGPTNEASRAEANARSNAKAAARLVATRALVKPPAFEVNPQTEPHIEPHIAASDSAPTEASQTDNKAANATAALAADMAAWVAALKPAAAQAKAAVNSQPSGEFAVTEAALTTQMVTQAAVQTVADKNTQVLREEAVDDRHDAAQDDAQRGAAGQRGAIDLQRPRAGSDGAGSSGRDAGGDRQSSESRGSREANEARAASSAPTDLRSTPPAAIAMAMLNKEPATATTASSSADFSALMASNLNLANAARGAPDSSTLSLSTPVNTPEFREALGLQVSLLARDGVQTAELHLNPADMGPVSIQIVMEGNQARVDFGADVAATRAAIEAGMPELASALLDAGFTLAGGGVSQHAKNQSQSEGEDRQGLTRRGIAAAAAKVVDSAPQPTQRRVQVTAGGVDLFA